MPITLQRHDRQSTIGRIIEQAVDLLSQQIWCWGQDVLRREGNWLLELGFNRAKPPASRKDCSSVYTLEIPNHRRVVLRGFGVFFGDDRWGGVFLPRHDFRPKYTDLATLRCPPWSDDDLPTLRRPNAPQGHSCVMLTLQLIDWIRGYEVDIADRLGIEYRRRTLAAWDNGKRSVIAAETMASAWRALSIQVAGNFDAFAA
ncbi:hypothetical protein [Crateriforma conspicua]|uniref:Uncharacterized protein n=1 Tax=Crateriforma conspicua TaxID=2527996 RepID=A0A5C6FMJ2_9PLAN|nr:hypothetical protein [Crateriforma conspicua]TWU62504.1 hypothetical protein V7x_42390 [Crateriforma conspicua]